MKENFKAAIGLKSGIPYLDDPELCQYCTLNQTCVSSVSDLDISREMYEF